MNEEIQSATENPYRAPLVEVDETAEEPQSEAEAIRRRLINHEMSVGAIGGLFIVGGLISISLGTIVIISTDDATFVSTARMVGLIALGVLLLVTAIGLDRLQPWARIPFGLFSGAGLFYFPIGTIIGTDFLYLVFSTKGRQVFSAEYKKVVDATPHVKNKTSLGTWIQLEILLLLLAGAWLAEFVCYW